MGAPKIVLAGGRKRKGAGVGRVSLEKQVGNYSLGTQGHLFTEYEIKYGVEIPREYLVEDAGFSGANFDRPSIKRVIRWSQRAEIEFVCFTHIDRFARDLEGGLRLIREFREAGLDILFGNLGWYQDERWFRNQVALYLMMAENAKEDIRLKSRQAVQQKLRMGIPHGGRAPYGWHFVTGEELALEQMGDKFDPEKWKLAKHSRPQNVLRRVEAEIVVVRLIYDLAIDGFSIKGIVRELIARGIPGPARSGRPNTPWWDRTIAKYLADKERVYRTGIWHYGKRIAVKPKKIRTKGERHREATSWLARPQSEWQPYKLDGGPVITQEIWERAQETIKRTRRTTTGRPSERHDYELSGMTICDYCESCVCGKSKGKNSWYGCNKRDPVHNRYLCPGKRFVRTDPVNRCVWQTMADALTTDLEKHVEEHRRSLLDTVDAEEVERLQARHDKLTKEMLWAIDKEIDEDNRQAKQRYSDRVAKAKAELKLIERRMAAVRATGETIAPDTKTIVACIKVALAHATDPAKRKLILSQFVEGVRLRAGNKKAKEPTTVYVTLRIPLAWSRNGEREEHDARQIDTTGNAHFVTTIERRIAA